LSLSELAGFNAPILTSEKLDYLHRYIPYRNRRKQNASQFIALSEFNDEKPVF
jgi:hypothetical protein